MSPTRSFGPCRSPRIEIFGDIDLADVLDNRGLVFVGAVREVEAEDIYAGLYELQQFVIGVTSWSYGSDDLCFMKSVLQACFFIHILVQVLR
jgi:hypothetical protein